MKNLFMVAALVVLLAGGISYPLVRANRKAPKSVPAYTLVSVRKMTFPGRAPVIDEVSIRSTKSTGEFIEERLIANQKVIHLWRDNQFLRYDPDQSKLTLISEDKQGQNSGWTEAGLRASKPFHREETVLGVKTFVMRIPQGDDGYLDNYVAPSLQVVIKRVQRTPQIEMVIEPISLTYGEPDEVVFARVPRNLPVVKESQ
jgi:hypothetical protein